MSDDQYTIAKIKNILNYYNCEIEIKNEGNDTFEFTILNECDWRFEFNGEIMCTIVNIHEDFGIYLDCRVDKFLLNIIKCIKEGKNYIPIV